VRSTIFVLVLLLSAFFVVATDTVSAAQEGDYTYTTSGSPVVATITGYTGAGGAITIPPTLGGYDTVAIGNNAFYNCTSLTSVNVPSSVTSIGDWAFYNCTSLTSVNVPSSVTSIGDYAFAVCASLTSVTIPSSVTSIGDYAFSFCTSLTSVTIPSSVTSIGDGAFAVCASLTTIDVNTDNPNYASIDGVLYDKTITTLIQYPGGRVGAFTIRSSVTSIGGWAFNSCTSLTSVTIRSSIASIGEYAFSSCTSLTSITFLGLAPTTVGANWILDTPMGIRGHAYPASNFPAPGGDFHGLTMGAVIGSPAIDNTMLILVAVIAITVVLVAMLFAMSRRKGKK